jgi:hypothetical protein
MLCYGKAFFYYAHEPTGEWWAASRPMLTLRHVTPPAKIFGRAVTKFAHRADVLRLELLVQFGGTYMDMDVILLSDTYMDALHAHELTLAQEGVDAAIGLGNALVVAAANSTFLRAWFDKYRDFSDAVWNKFSVRLPSQLARAMPDAVHVVGYDTFYWPPWNPWGIAQLYRTARCLMPGAVGVHLWETKMFVTRSNFAAAQCRIYASCCGMP